MHKEFMGLSDDIHRYIVLELFLKTLERDRDQITHLKMKDVVEEWYNSKINDTFQEFKKLRDFLYKKGCKIEKQKSDDFMTYYFILFRGYDETRSYSNIALRNWVSEEMKRVLGMKFLTPADRK